MRCKVGDLGKKLLAMSEVDAGGCLIWSGSKSTKGYGRVWWEGRLHQAHRASYTANVGAIPEGLHVLHRCDNPSCINHEHLFLGTNLDNVQDKVAKGRLPSGESRANAKLTEAAVLEIRKSPLGKKSLAKLYGVCPTVILEVRRGKRWPHVRDPGDDARDESLSWLPVPSREEVSAC